MRDIRAIGSIKKVVKKNPSVVQCVNFYNVPQENDMNVFEYM